jgi:hypothetical protein
MSTVDDRATLVLGGSGFVGRRPSLGWSPPTSSHRSDPKREGAKHLILLPTVDGSESTS